MRRQRLQRRGVSIPSRSLPRHPLNTRHVVVKNSLHAAIIPFDSYARPIRFSDSALIGRRGSPANAFANSECSGLFAGHSQLFLFDSQPPLSRAFLARCREYFVPRLCWLLHLWKSGAFAGAAFDFWQSVFGF
jgi:hypothetical protein